MQNNKVLFIVEGESDEVRFLKRMFHTCFSNQNYEIYSYKTNIHVLAQLLFQEYPDFESDEIDIKLVLRSLEENEHKREILSHNYRDVFLIFDFEPQHDIPHFDTIRRMVRFFDDSTDRGRLFINYPMMQSYKHFARLPDDSFADKKVNLEQIKQYKYVVGNESSFTDLNQYSYFTFLSLAVHHIRKANYILSGKYTLPDVEDFLAWGGLNIFDIQCSMFALENEVYVLNTSIFMIMEFAPNNFIHQVTTSKERFDI